MVTSSSSDSARSGGVDFCDEAECLGPLKSAVIVLLPDVFGRDPAKFSKNVDIEKDYYADSELFFSRSKSTSTMIAINESKSTR